MHFIPCLQIMGLNLNDSDDLTDDQLKAAFRAAAMKWHPDKHVTGAHTVTVMRVCGT